MEWCFYCGSLFCDEDCAEAWEAREDWIKKHVETCTKDGFCEICQRW